MSYSVEQRTQEIGIRAALGATQLDIVRLVLRQAFQISMIGIAAGIVCALALMRFLTAQLFHVKPTDPLTLVLAPLILLVVSLIGAFIPALRATQTDPIAPLRRG
jgi:putative ABC transport system permease protein